MRRCFRLIQLVRLAAFALAATCIPAVRPVAAQTDRPIEFAEGSFRLPSADWRIPPVDRGLLAGDLVQAAQRLPGHELLIDVHVKVESTDSAQNIVAALVSANSVPDDANWTVDSADAGPRTIDGVDYPSLRFSEHDGAGETIDEVLVWIFPQDFSVRRRIVSVNIVDRHPSGLPVVSLDEVDSVVASMQLRPVGAVVLSDDFSDAAVGVLLRTSREPTHYQVSYRPGAYDVFDVDPTWNGSPELPVGLYLPFARIAIDVTFATDALGQLAYIGCRRASTEGSGYRLLLDAPRGRATLQRLDKGQSRALADWVYLAAIAPPTGTNHLELACATPTISATVNGALVGSVDDVSYAGGRLWLGSSNFPETWVQTAAAFTNLVVSQS